MPLFTITTPLAESTEERHPRPVITFGHSLPDFCCAHLRQLWLEDQTTSDAVQVTFRSFGLYDINIPDIWVVGRFTEDIDPRHQIAVRDFLWQYTQNWFMPVKGPGPMLAMDLFWGSGHGCLDYGDAKFSW